MVYVSDPSTTLKPVGEVYVSDPSNTLRPVGVACVSDILSDCCWTSTLTGWQKHSSPSTTLRSVGVVYVSDSSNTLMSVDVVYVSDPSNILRSVDVADVSDILSDCYWTGALTGWQKHSSPFHDTEVTGCGLCQ